MCAVCQQTTGLSHKFEGMEAVCGLSVGLPLRHLREGLILGKEVCGGKEAVSGLSAGPSPKAL